MDDEIWEMFVSMHLNDRPSWIGCPGMCTRWHIKGDCYKDCRKAASHVPRDKCPADKENEMRRYVKKVRNE